MDIKGLETNRVSQELHQKLYPGRVPFWLRQKALVSVSAHTLRPGGFLLTRRALECCDFTPEDRILDLGCGFGMTLGFLHEAHGITGTGVDPDPKILKGARWKLAPKIRLVRAGLPSLPFPPEMKTGVFCECVLSLAREPEPWLQEIYRVLAPNGKLIITDLYIRKWSPARPPGPAMEKHSCCSGARPMVDMIRTIEDTGFKVDIIEDHTALLSQLGLPSRDNKLGYCMIIAGKYPGYA